ncbi:putative pentatricopeptide repeat-containing protein [Cinnamomum micranthum f. kanehirae]|uniref:Putative pentatricopeptide repeat-containing protein n=1 Tax=Cinnamomum micranthum f. kanehirae TaxID=337451 RepID=A0A443NES7_9MAGN|nr:putative pentatricopeptide repeat-containing protein [Cinnamomum micranthum f. kanehirae]
MSSLSNHYSSLLKFCCESHNQIQAKRLHCIIIKALIYRDTFLSNNLISTYYKLNNLRYAHRVFDQIPQPNLFSWNTLLSAYSKSGNLPNMIDVFDRMPVRDGVSWNAIISGYSSYGFLGDSVRAYKLMLEEGESPNRITFSTMLILSSGRSLVDLGRQIHCQITKFGFESYVFVGSPLVYMYSKAGAY